MEESAWEFFEKQYLMLIEDEKITNLQEKDNKNFELNNSRII